MKTPSEWGLLLHCSDEHRQSCFSVLEWPFYYVTFYTMTPSLFRSIDPRNFENDPNYLKILNANTSYFNSAHFTARLLEVRIPTVSSRLFFLYNQVNTGCLMAIIISVAFLPLVSKCICSYGIPCWFAKSTGYKGYSQKEGEGIVNRGGGETQLSTLPRGRWESDVL